MGHLTGTGDVVVTQSQPCTGEAKGGRQTWKQMRMIWDDSC